MEKGMLTRKSLGGNTMAKFSEFKNGRSVKRIYKVSKDDQKKIDKKVAACRNALDKDLLRLTIKIEKLKKSSDKVEIYRFAINESKKEIREININEKEVLDMLPSPVSEQDRQVSKFLISHHKSMIGRFEKAIRKEKGGSGIGRKHLVKQSIH